MFTDADIEMAELEQAGNMIAVGICPICEDALDPIAYKAVYPASYSSPRYTAEIAARCVGPISKKDPCYHEDCLNELLDDAGRP